MILNKHNTKRDIESDTPNTESSHAHRFHDNNDISPSRLQHEDCQSSGQEACRRWDEPWSDEVPDRSQHGQQYKDGSSGNVSPAEERVLPANPRNR